MEKEECERILKLTRENRELLKQSNCCGCYYCQNIFNPDRIYMWYNDRVQTAICPYCKKDKVIGDYGLNHEISVNFLIEIKAYFYNEKVVDMLKELLDD